MKLRHLNDWTEGRRRVVRQYNELLADCDVETPKEMPWGRHVYHVYTLRVNDRDNLHAALSEEGIQTGIHYPIPAHLQPAYSDLGYGPGSFPQAEKAAKQVISLPLYPELTDEAIGEVAAAVKRAVRKPTGLVSSRGDPSPMSLEVVELFPENDAELTVFLDALARRSPSVLAYHYPFYRDMLTKLGVGRPLYLGLRRSGQLLDIFRRS